MTNKPSDKAIYRYDYGDNWEMSITLEKILPKTKNTKYPLCIGGKLAAPPEDCGSIPGYYRCPDFPRVHAFFLPQENMRPIRLSVLYDHEILQE
jgi:hypothetical protein